MDEAEMRRLLAEAQAAKGDSISHARADEDTMRAAFRALHRLAEAGYEPALPFFVSCLTDRDPDWRLQGLQDLGWHYKLPTGSPILEQIRSMLETDPDADVRIAAASILGFQADQAQVWPDWALLAALREDPVYEVRIAAFQSLLLTANIRGVDLRDLDRRVKRGEIQPTWEEVERIVTAARGALPTPDASG